jgi:hypothetical protein
MIRKSGNRFSEEIMLKKGNQIMIRFNLPDHDLRGDAIFRITVTITAAATLRISAPSPT